MKKKALVSTMLVVTLAASLLAGCKGKTAGSSAQGAAEDDGFVYVPEFRTMTTGINEDIYGVRLVEDKLKSLIILRNKDYEPTGIRVHTEDKDGQNGTDKEFEYVFDKEEYISGFEFNGSQTIITCTKYGENGNTYSIAYFDENGKCTSKNEIAAFSTSDDEAEYYTFAGVDKEGYAVFTSWSGTVARVSSDGTLVDKVSAENKDTMDSFWDKEGNFYVSAYEGMDVNFDMVDFASKSFKTKWSKISGYPRKVFDEGNGTLLIFGDERISEFATESNENTALVNYIDIDMNNVSPDAAWINEDGTISFVAGDYGAEGVTYEVVTLKKIEKTADMAKNEVHMAVGFLSYDQAEAIRNFNKTNGEIRVVVDSYLNEETGETDTTAFNADLSAGKIDIVRFEDFKDALKNDNLVDLNPYLDSDPDINRSDYFENIFEGLETKGKLYSIAPNFNVYGYGANSDYLPESDNFDFDRFVKLIKDNPGKMIIPDELASQFLSDVVALSGNRFIDYENAKCDFNNEEFISLMEFAKTKPLTFESSDFEDFDPLKSIMNGETILFGFNVSDSMDIQLYRKILGDKFYPAGLPTDGERTFAYSVSNSYAIVKNSAKVDEAWKYLRTLLLDKYQSMDYMGGFPISKKFFETKIARMLKGEGVGGGAVYTGDTMIELGEPSSEAINLMKECVESAGLFKKDDSGVASIIDEEFRTYVSGAKSAEEVAEIIQSRISIYLSEKFG